MDFFLPDSLNDCVYTDRLSSKKSIRPSREARSPVCVFWSGGKDSFLAYILSTKINRFRLHLFVTFIPKAAHFLCHPLHILQSQSRHIGVTHEFLVIDPNNWRSSLTRSLFYLKQKYHVKTITTGDIISCDPEYYYFARNYRFRILYSEWIKMLRDLKLYFNTPLSKLFAEDIIIQLESQKINAYVTGLSELCFVPNFLGHRITLDRLNLSGYANISGIDLCGERGEYHTSVLSYGNERFWRQNPLRLSQQLKEGVWSLNWGGSRFDIKLKTEI